VSVPSHDSNVFHIVRTIIKYPTVRIILKYPTVRIIPKYHTIRTIPKYHTVRTITKYHTVYQAMTVMCMCVRGIDFVYVSTILIFDSDSVVFCDCSDNV
jgi:hypothetical protein